MKKFIAPILALICLATMALVIPAKRNAVKHPAVIKPMKVRRKQTSIEIPLIFVEGGSFKMGEDRAIDAEARPAHTVTVSSFYIAKYEVTQAQWRLVMGTTPSKHQYCDDCPVTNVSWNDANEFCRRINNEIGVTSTRHDYHLPTEAQWEYAARGGNKSMGYYFSGSSDINEVAWYADNSGGQTQIVGTKKPNELGIYDMSGNACEWCSDEYDANYYSVSPIINPTGPSPYYYHRVCRGGSYDNNYGTCMVFGRIHQSGDDYLDSNSGYFDIGFRLVAD